MPYKSAFPTIPFLDPDYDPNHPAHSLPPLDDDPYLPLSPRTKRMMEKQRLEAALEDYHPTHVIRSYEHDPDRAARHARIMSLTLNDVTHSATNFPTEREAFPENDIRPFLMMYIHVQPHRIHQEDPNDPDTCWNTTYRMTESNIFRRRIALALGLFPAVIDPECSAYDEELESRYYRRLLCRCTRRSALCLRPSHIEIFAPSGELLP